MRWERGGRGLAGTWTGASWLAVALAMAVLVIALVDSAPVIQRARHSMRQASELGMTVQFDYGDVFFNETLYVADAVSYLGCSASTCSSSCDSSTPFTGTTCYDNQTCLNMTQGYVYDKATLTAGDNKFYALTFPPCSNLIVLAFPSSGSVALYMGQDSVVYPSGSGYYWGSSAGNSRPVPRSFCCGQGSPNFDANQPLFINVYANSNVTYELFIYDMNELLPAKYFYRYIDMTVTCGDSECSTWSDPSCTNTGITLPSNETGMHYLAMRGKDPLPGVQFESNDAQVSFWRQVETVSPHQLLEAYEPSLANCSVSFVNLVNADGESVAESAPLELYEPECDEIKFEAAVAGLHSLNALYDTATSNDNFYQLLFYSNAFVATDGWFGCKSWVDQSFVRKKATYNTTQSSIRCSSVDPAFNATTDPCCNNLLLFEDNCVAREIDYAVTTYEAVQARVEAMCSLEPGCMYLSLEDYAASMEFEDDPTRNCAANIIDAGGFRSQDHGGDCEARLLGTYCDSVIDCPKGQACSVFRRCAIPCQVDSDCPTNSTCQWGGACSHVPLDVAAQNALLAECVMEKMSDEEKNYIRAQWGLTDAQSEGSAFFDVFVANVTAPTCKGGPEIDMYSRTGHCEGSPSCNWAPCQIKPFNSSNRDYYCESNCENKTYATTPAEPDHFCGLCSAEDPESCFEVSQYWGCYMTGDKNIIDNGKGCEWFKMLFSPDVYSNYIDQECVFDMGLVTSAHLCLTSSSYGTVNKWFLGDCEYVRLEVDSYGQSRYVCDGYCHLHSTATANYEPLCNPQVCEDLFGGPCVWNPVAQSCVLKSYQSYSECLFSPYGSLLYWNHEFAWNLPALDTASSCTAGSCFPHGPGIDQTTCESTPWCTVDCAYGPCANQTDCEAAGACDDAELTNPLLYRNVTTGDPFDPIDGVCVFPFQLEADSFGVTVSCPEWAKQGRVGCIDYHVYSEGDCLASVPAYGTPRWMRSAATQGDCLAYGMGCLEETYTYAESVMGNPGTGFLSPKNESACLAAGGTPTPYYNWHQGTWYPGGRWQGFEWKQRNWTTQYNKRLVEDFSLSAYATLSTAAQISQLSSRFKSDQFCRYNRLIDMFSAVTCSCHDSTPDGSCGQNVGVTVGVSRTCSHTDFDLPLPGVGRVSWTRELAFDPTCVDVNVYSVAVSQFQKEGDTTFVSNIFVKAIESEPEGYSIVENSHGVIVGQLIGDGLRIELTNGGQKAHIITSATDADFTVCMYVRSDIALDSFDEYDLALSNEDYSEWTPMNARNVRITDEGLICGTLPLPYPPDLNTIFPVWRESGDWAGETFIESLSTSTVALFYLAVALYTLLLIPNTLAIINQFWLFRYELADSGDKSFGSVAWTLLSMGRIIHCCIEAILILRVIYFAMLPTGVLNNVNVVVYVILGEVPVYLFLSIYTLLLFFWVELVHWALKKKGGQSVLKRMKVMFLGVNGFLYAFLLVLVIIFIALEASISSTDTSCSSPYFLDQSDPNSEMKDARTGLAIFYQSVIIAVALVLAIAFAVYGVWVLLTLYRVKSMSKRLAKMKRNKMIKFSVVLAVCTLSLLCMCGFLLYGTIDQSMSAVGAIIFVIVVELLPLTLLIFTVYSKRKSVFRLWYSYAKSRGLTSAFSSSADSRAEMLDQPSSSSMAVDTTGGGATGDDSISSS